LNLIHIQNKKNKKEDAFHRLDVYGGFFTGG
jgi:hypothetical protein